MKSKALHAALYGADWLVVVSSAWLAHGLYLGTFDVPARYTVVIVIALLLSLWLPRFALYQTWRSASVLDEARSISLAWGSVLLGLMAFAFSTKSGAEYSRGWLGLWAALGWVGLILARVMVRVGLRWLRRRGFNQRHIVIAGSVGIGEQVMERLPSAPWMGLNVAGYFHGDPVDAGKTLNSSKRMFVSDVPRRTLSSVLADLPIGLQIPQRIC